ncbi:single-stranded DNA-binding protein [Actinocatenispora rupis]|uniref:Single-stranded DNA-binding protein n=1 Tax=Actinocatenispora rupis TaxID=519421 RepID=A0A8J3JAF6_9ACTN|nr:single-stranded DNA-binding protein [Actinocatenispora rupis]GID13062.1 single-stranded DNA-binding protein [Actinocatenispora rupis]
MANEPTTTIIGNLTADPDMSVTNSGVSWARFTVASTPRRFDKQSGQYVDGEALFMRCVAWRDLAEHITESLSKGTRVVVTGRLRQNTWETDDGQKRSSIDLDVDEIGPSLRFATAKVAKLARRNGNQPPAPDEPWATAPAGTGGGASGEFGDEPPF